MNRRGFIAGVGTSALLGSLPVAGWAQRADGVRRIGFLGANSPSLQSQWTAAFVGRLRELGWSEGSNLVVEYRWAEGRFTRSPELAAELVRSKVDVIVTHATANVIAAKQATSVIPIVFAAVPDPVGDNLVAGLARPGGNVTGLSNQAPDLAGKRVGFLRDIVSGLRRLAIVANVSSPNAILEMKEAEVAILKLGLEVSTFEIRKEEEFSSLFDALKGRAEALYVVSDPLLTSNRVRLAASALAVGLPTAYSLRENVEAGGLLSYGPNLPSQFRRAADLVDKILRGTKPGEIPVEQPSRFDLVINLTTAKALGLTIPETLLATADEVIQ
jgi:putative tryptophan/tyrosine transport system substrate-binding protein